ncbi:MAG: radical SAM protein [Planctomycetes bacterium]|nr:radical SAM protein [Planctomycetota bacterium]
MLSKRGARNAVDASRPYATLVEPERTAEGTIEDVATIFITNQECPFRCLMCDLWKNTTEDRVPVGSVASQVEWALGRLPPVPRVKLYNSGNFFDEQAISRQDRSRIVELVAGHRAVVVESHPRLVDERCAAFADALAPKLEVAMGLETIDPNVLPRLNKRMTLEDYECATRFLTGHGMAVRAFILLRTPFQSEEEGVDWALRSIEYAFSIGVSCCAVIPTRAGNGAMEALQAGGLFEPPTLPSIERVLERGIEMNQGRVFMDLWDLEKFHSCTVCGPARKKRLSEMNLQQTILPPVECGCNA